MKMFWKLIEEKMLSDLQMLQVILNDSVVYVKEVNGRRPYLRLHAVLEKYKSVLKYELFDGLQPKRFLNLEVKGEQGSKPPNRPFCQLLPEEKRLQKSISKTW